MGVEKNYQKVKYKKTELLKKQLPTSDTQRRESKKQKTEAEDKVISFPDNKSNNQK